MIMVKAKMTAKSGEKNNIIAKAQDLIKSSRLDQGCINYNLYTSTENENVLLILEQWENFELLQSHMQTEHFKTFGTATKDILAREMDINVYTAEIKY